MDGGISFREGPTGKVHLVAENIIQDELAYLKALLQK
jgi:hypothetical protein